VTKSERAFVAVTAVSLSLLLSFYFVWLAMQKKKNGAIAAQTGVIGGKNSAVSGGGAMNTGTGSGSSNTGNSGNVNAGTSNSGFDFLGIGTVAANPQTQPNGTTLTDTELSDQYGITKTSDGSGNYQISTPDGLQLGSASVLLEFFTNN
jgi:hypothetical protein